MDARTPLADFDPSGRFSSNLDRQTYCDCAGLNRIFDRITSRANRQAGAAGQLSHTIRPSPAHCVSSLVHN